MDSNVLCKSALLSLVVGQIDLAPVYSKSVETKVVAATKDFYLAHDLRISIFAVMLKSMRVSIPSDWEERGVNSMQALLKQFDELPDAQQIVSSWLYSFFLAVTLTDVCQRKESKEKTASLQSAISKCQSLLLLPLSNPFSIFDNYEEILGLVQGAVAPQSQSRIRDDLAPYRRTRMNSLVK